MAAARPLPATGSIFLDARGGDRALRVSWHAEADLVVLSLWRDNVCAGSFRLAIDEVPELIEMLRARPRPGLRRRAAHPPRSRRPRTCAARAVRLAHRAPFCDSRGKI